MSENKNQSLVKVSSTQPVKPKWFDFRQNNSGGRFRGPAIHIIVEAIDAEEANAIAERNGAYFNGCDTGADCECCGDRWSTMWGDDRGEDLPSVGGTPLVELTKEPLDAHWSRSEKVPYALIVYRDGRKELFAFREGAL